MAGIERRDFLKAVGGAACLSMLTGSIARAAEIEPHYRTGTIEDVEHVVILMQENRSFDHYLGTMRGVRGFGDPHPLLLPSGRPVWFQQGKGGTVLPYRPEPVKGQQLGLLPFSDPEHDWDSGHRAWNEGRYDGWVKYKQQFVMAQLTREDVPFHHALAEAFTICDSYHCSLNGWTDPNRYYMWTGCVDATGRGGGPAILNYDAKTTPARTWTTYPERLERHNVTWKVYQDIGRGLTRQQAWGWVDDNACIGNFGDNSLLHFRQYENARPDSALYRRARTGTRIDHGDSDTPPDFEGLFSLLRSDVQGGRLPQVSWIAAPEIFNEHPVYPANYGAWYVAKVLDALTSDPEVWSRTALIVTYDENGGFFDHVPPPFPPENPTQGKSTVSVEDEHYDGPDGVPGPYGLGPRVPTFVISPWSRGGWVCSQVFDHTSLIRFIERRFGVHEPQITPWRRTVCGDLTSAFDFTRRNDSLPALPSTDAYLPPQCKEEGVDPQPPENARLPRQEPGLRLARPLPYDLAADCRLSPGQLHIDFTNQGGSGASFHVTNHQGTYGPWTYTVAEGSALSDNWKVAGAYDFCVRGPNGFLRRFTGHGTHPAQQVNVRASHSTDDDGQLVIHLTNHGTRPQRIALIDAATQHTTYLSVPAGMETVHRIGCQSTHHWYDVTLTWGDQNHPQTYHLCGHIETGRPSTSDPAFARGTV
ncbi:phospholipase C, phosphocholine-specific [Streptomyces sp. H27-H1]|uniref:phosphocholine-specific phospholipase C n=1 Tax=Streptomyces sp. H27-H1 TaxID=2996461 RepID=UPI00226D9AEA|nr:phospholipase C, phosphocholine-specific [Streptomyces sp. H27-H1]MCY0932471.1 phospholipase C, phosphocholine-specific [Streptomyces sp. H27-H1]